MFQENVKLTSLGIWALHVRIQLGDATAPRELALNYLPFVRGYVAWRMRKAKLDQSHFEDLFSECIIAMFKAADNFNPNYGAGLPTYAKYYLKNAVDNHIARVINGTTASMAVIKKINKFEEIRKQLERDGEPITVQVMSKRVRIPVSLSKQLLEKSISIGPAYSLSKLISDANGSDGVTWEDRLVTNELDAGENLSVVQASAILKEALLILSERECHIIKQRYLHDDPVVLEELSKQFKITRERVRQIEMKALEKLQKHLKKKYKAHSFADLAGP